ncbi:MAG: hypothetical protein HY512_02635 [Candidatus Aenigmarchaeota archaeon]|nr:hypothetical protein [Candidatus Aenigmarchaeota archaeon]
MGFLNVLGSYFGIEPEMQRLYEQRNGNKWGIDVDGVFYRKFVGRYLPILSEMVPKHIRTELQSNGV